LLFLCLVASATSAQRLKFKFVYGVGASKEQEALLFYEFVPESGVPAAKNPISVKSNAIEEISVPKKTTEIRFSGTLLTGNQKTGAAVMVVSKLVRDLKKKEDNVIQLIGIPEGSASPTPLPEVINQLAQARYNELLTKPKGSTIEYAYANVRPIGTFVLYDRNLKRVSGEAIVMPATSKPFVEISKRIQDHYLLKKKAGVTFEMSYARLVNAEVDVNKTQYIEYDISIDTLEILHWQSKTSEMQYLFDEVQNKRLNHIKTALDENSDLDFLFISSCVKVSKFKLSYSTHDSIGSAETANLAVPGGQLSMRGGVVYSRQEGTTNNDYTDIYHTGFSVRDYTSYIKSIFTEHSLQQKINNARADVEEKRVKVGRLFEDLRRADPGLANLENTETIVALVNILNSKDPWIQVDSMSVEQRKDVDDRNAAIVTYNATLSAVKSVCYDYSEALKSMNDLVLAQARKETNLTQASPPADKKVNDAVFDSLFISSKSASN